MRRRHAMAAIGGGLLAGCGGGTQQAPAPAAGSKPPQPRGEYRIYVTNESSGDMTVIDSANHDVIATVKLGKRPRGIQAGPGGKLIYVALSGSPIAPPGTDESKLPPPDRSADGIGIVDPRENKLLRMMRVGQDPEQFALSADGLRLYVSNEDDAKTSIVDMEHETVAATVAVGEEPEGVTITPDGRFVYVTSENDGAVFVIDAGNNKLKTSFRVGRRPRTVVFLRDGSKGYVTMENEAAIAVVDARRHRLLRTIGLGPKEVKPMGLALSPDGSRLYASSGRFQKVFVIDTAADKVLESFDAGQRPWGIGLSPDGKTLYTANGPGNDVSVIDVATRTVTMRVKAGDRPWGVLVLPAPK